MISISTKGEFRLSSSINDEFGESLVDTTLSILKILLLGFISFLLIRKGKIPVQYKLPKYIVFLSFFYFLFFNFYFYFLISNVQMYFSSSCIFFYNKINKIMKVYSLPCLKKKKKFLFLIQFIFLFIFINININIIIISSCIIFIIIIIFFRLRLELFKVTVDIYIWIIS